ncbi:MAG: hypothetical protein PHN80_17455 [Hespellia sp.]|nr:hypothetical protein [Hespellia sp.]
MKRNFFAVVLSVSLILCSCGGSSADLSDNLSVKIDDDNTLSLYASREDTESILGSASGTNALGLFEYGSVSIGYTDDKVSAIVLEDDFYSTVPGLRIGSSDYADMDLSFAEIGKNSISETYFSYSEGEYSQIDDSISDASFEDGAYLDVIVDDSNSIKTIGIYDMYSAKTADFDK